MSGGVLQMDAEETEVPNLEYTDGFQVQGNLVTLKRECKIMGESVFVLSP